MVRDRNLERTLDAECRAALIPALRGRAVFHGTDDAVLDGEPYALYLRGVRGPVRVRVVEGPECLIESVATGALLRAARALGVEWRQ